MVGKTNACNNDQAAHLLVIMVSCPLNSGWWDGEHVGYERFDFLSCVTRSYRKGLNEIRSR